MPTEERTATGEVLTLATTGAEDRAELLELFRQVVAAGEGYPQDPDVPLTVDDFDAYWLAPSVANVVARLDGRLVGGYTMKPNGVGRAAHVANAGFIVAGDVRGRGIGELLVRHAMDLACDFGFDAMQFNFVFESNPARRLYERLGFEVVGRVPEVIGDEAVLIYWRRLSC